jgi:fluoride ion exporter CrcB/FEX
LLLWDLEVIWELFQDILCQMFYRFLEAGGADDGSGYNGLLDLFQLQTFLLPTFIGCFIMGMLFVLKKRGFGQPSDPVAEALMIGAATGFCGCLTTFSSWIGKYSTHAFDKYWFADLSLIVIEFAINWLFFLMGMSLTELYFELEPPDSIDLNRLKIEQEIASMNSASARPSETYQPPVPESNSIRLIPDSHHQ